MTGNDCGKIDWGHDMETPVSYTMELGFYFPRHWKIKEFKTKESHRIHILVGLHCMQGKVQNQNRVRHIMGPQKFLLNEEQCLDENGSDTGKSGQGVPVRDYCNNYSK